jgi:hypothetical protein
MLVQYISVSCFNTINILGQTINFDSQVNKTSVVSDISGHYVCMSFRTYFHRHSELSSRIVSRGDMSDALTAEWLPRPSPKLLPHNSAAMARICNANDGDSLLLFGGYAEGASLDALLKYHIASKTWSRIECPLGGPWPSARAGACMMQNPCDPSEVFLAGGLHVETNTFSADLWSFKDGVWASTSSSSFAASSTSSFDGNASSPSHKFKTSSGVPYSPRWHVSLAHAANRMFCVGGEGPNYESFADTHVYDLQLRQWLVTRVVVPFPEPRHLHTASSLHDKIYVIGGASPRGQAHPVWVLDAPTMRWTPLETKSSASNLPFSGAVSGHSTVLLDDTYMLVYGGISGGVLQDKCWILDPRSAQWIPVSASTSSFASKKQPLSSSSSSSSSPSSPGLPNRSHHAGTAPPIARWKHAAAMVSDDTMLVVGGITEHGRSADSLELLLHF